MLLELFLIILGLILLVAGSDKFVESGSRIARKLQVSDFVIGLTLIAVGTSLPELASSIVSSIKGSSGLIVGNLVGSNIANIGLIVGVSATIASIKIHETMLKRDGYIMLFVSIIFTLLSVAGIINYLGGLVLISIYVIYTLFLVESKKQIQTKWHFREFVAYAVKLKFFGTLFNHDSRNKPVNKDGILIEFIISGVSLAVLIYGAKLLVGNSLYLSAKLGISETFIGVALIAIGTSLPELAVSISSIKKGFHDILIGNIIGSNIANISLVFGISSVIRPVTIAISSLNFLIPAMLFFSVFLLIALKNSKINRLEGILLLSAYVLFLLLSKLWI